MDDIGLKQYQNSNQKLKLLRHDNINSHANQCRYLSQKRLKSMHTVNQNCSANNIKINASFLDQQKIEQVVLDRAAQSKVASNSLKKIFTKTPIHKQFYYIQQSEIGSIQQVQKLLEMKSANQKAQEKMQEHQKLYEQRAFLQQMVDEQEQQSQIYKNFKQLCHKKYRLQSGKRNNLTSCSQISDQCPRSAQSQKYIPINNQSEQNYQGLHNTAINHNHKANYQQFLQKLKKKNNVIKTERSEAIDDDSQLNNEEKHIIQELFGIHNFQEDNTEQAQQLCLEIEDLLMQLKQNCFYKQDNSINKSSNISQIENKNGNKSSNQQQFIYSTLFTRREAERIINKNIEIKQIGFGNLKKKADYKNHQVSNPDNLDSGVKFDIFINQLFKKLQHKQIQKMKNYMFIKPCKFNQKQPSIQINGMKSQQVNKDNSQITSNNNVSADFGQDSEQKSTKDQYQDNKSISKSLYIDKLQINKNNKILIQDQKSKDKKQQEKQIQINKINEKNEQFNLKKVQSLQINSQKYTNLFVSKSYQPSQHYNSSQDNQLNIKQVTVIKKEHTQ